MKTFLLRYIRSIILYSSILLAIGVYAYYKTAIPDGAAQITKTEEAYAFLSITYLYFSLLWGPLYGSFPKLPVKALFFKARRAIGVSSFLFALLHTYLTFFPLLGGFSGLGFLSNNYLFSVGLGFVGFFILLLLTITSLDYAVNRLGKHWKKLHRFIYLAGFVILLHTIILGSHFARLSETISKIFIIAVSILLLLEAVRFDVFINKRFSIRTKYGVTTACMISLITIALFFSFFPSGNSTSQIFNIHAQHQLLAQQAFKDSQQNQQTTNVFPGLNGDKTKRYTVSFNHPDIIEPNQDAPLSFTVFDASNGNPVTFFRTLYTKPMHLIIVDSTLTYFSHIHPEQQAVGGFTITTQFPHIGSYHLYVDFQPFGGIEQQIGFSLPIGVNSDQTISSSSKKPDATLTKAFGDYEVTFDTHGKLDKDAMSLGNQKISFTIKNAKTKKPITTLQPYLGAFGHLVMINQKTFDYIHVHPVNILLTQTNQNGGPTVDFLPIGIYGPFNEGTYRVFAQFNPDGKLFTADFTVQVN